jgi:hypothetical protein
MGGNIELGSVLSPNLSNSAKIPTSKKANHHNLLGIHGPAFLFSTNDKIWWSHEHIKWLYLSWDQHSQDIEQKSDKIELNIIRLHKTKSYAGSIAQVNKSNLFKAVPTNLC